MKRDRARVQHGCGTDHARCDHVSLGKLWLTLAICVGVIVLRVAVAGLLRALGRGHPRNRLVFWTDQAASLAALVCILVACVAIWVDDPARLTSVLGIASAGVAIAAQKAVTSFAGYLVIMRGKTGSEEAVPNTISNSSRTYRRNLKMLTPLARSRDPRQISTKLRQVR